MAKSYTGYKVGRPSKYKEIYCKRLIEFFSRDRVTTQTSTLKKTNGEIRESTVVVANELPFFVQFELENNLSPGKCSKWNNAKDRDGNYKYPSFRKAYSIAKGLQEQFLASNAIQGYYQPHFSVFAAKNILGWRDQQDIDHTTDGKPLNLNVVSYSQPKDE